MVQVWTTEKIRCFPGKRHKKSLFFQKQNKIQLLLENGGKEIFDFFLLFLEKRWKFIDFYCGLHLHYRSVLMICYKGKSWIPRKIFRPYIFEWWIGEAQWCKRFCHQYYWVRWCRCERQNEIPLIFWENDRKKIHCLFQKQPKTFFSWKTANFYFSKKIFCRLHLHHRNLEIKAA